MAHWLQWEAGAHGVHETLESLSKSDLICLLHDLHGHIERADRDTRKANGEYQRLHLIQEAMLKQHMRLLKIMEFLRPAVLRAEKSAGLTPGQSPRMQCPHCVQGCTPTEILIPKSCFG